MPTRLCTIATLLLIASAALAAAPGRPAAGAKYMGLKYTVPPSATWKILDFDGAHRNVTPYLSSLGGGEAATGVIASPTFVVAGDKITFTICGHDGQGGGRGKNFIALVDIKTGQVLKRTPAPGVDAMQERSWDVAPIKGRKVRVEVHDGLAEGAYAWLGIGRLEAGPAMTVDFKSGMPDGWKFTTAKTETKTELVADGVPFLRCPAAYTLIPATGSLEIPCGFAAHRIFLLGCTVPGGKPTEVYGTVEITYRGGGRERFPLMVGFTLDDDDKMLSPSKAIHLHPSSDPFQHYLALAPKPEVIEKVTLAKDPEHGPVPRITAVTFRTAAAADNLQALPEAKLSPQEEAWIRSHAISSASPNMKPIVAQIRRDHKMQSGK
jgi:hypothetical protein